MTVLSNKIWPKFLLLVVCSAAKWKWKMRSIKNVSSSWIFSEQIRRARTHTHIWIVSLASNYILLDQIYSIKAFYDIQLLFFLLSWRNEENGSVFFCFWRCSFLIYYTLDCNANFCVNIGHVCSLCVSLALVSRSLVRALIVDIGL